MINVETTKIPGVLILSPNLFKDQRGFFRETYQKKTYHYLGILDDFIQDNFSHSKKNILRGLHYQINKPQSQLVTLLNGTVFDVIVDLRENEKTFGQWVSVTLSEGGPSQIYMPPGVAHGFYVKSDFADLHYKVTNYYDPINEAGLKWNDEVLDISWPVAEPFISQRDSEFPSFLEVFGKKRDD
jgi:dTDP-4-dehydrorhamnose 3,5-epimerase